MPAKPVAARARVTAVRTLASEVLEADLAMVEPPTLAFDAGQWVSVPFGPKTVRAYSIASTPRVSSAITLCADVAPGGLGSRWFRGLTPGSEVEFKGPLGGFVWTPGETRRAVFVAEEIGIVPIRAILADLDEQGSALPATLVYWARDASWLVYDDELRTRARRRGAFAYHPIVRTGERVAADELASAVERLVTDVSGGVVAYVAGGEAAINRVREVLMAKGLERRAVKWEKFW
jgi:ferredoxin-NADP reductase